MPPSTEEEDFYLEEGILAAESMKQLAVTEAQGLRTCLMNPLPGEEKLQTDRILRNFYRAGFTWCFRGGTPWHA